MSALFLCPERGYVWPMKKRVLCLVADGVEELELVAPVDVLRRAGAERPVQPQ